MFLLKRPIRALLETALLTLGGLVATSPALACEPPGGIEGNQVTRSAHKITEFLEDGYRVTTCDSRGKVRKSITAANLPIGKGEYRYLPITVTERLSGKTMVKRNILYGDPGESKWVAHIRRALPKAEGELTKPSPPPSKSTSRDPYVDEGNDCTNSDYSTSGLSWPLDFWTGTKYIAYFGYRANDKVGATWVSGAITEVEDGQQAWGDDLEEAWQRCGVDPAPAVSYQTYYQGVSSSTAGSRDSVNVFDYNSTDAVGCYGALACTITFYYEGQTTILEADTRFSNQVPWSSAQYSERRPMRYDVQNVATHEAGHSAGLDHVTSSGDGYLTMYPSTCLGCLNQRTQGLGDMAGVLAIYPG